MYITSSVLLFVRCFTPESDCLYASYLFLDLTIIIIIATLLQQNTGKNRDFDMEGMKERLKETERMGEIEGGREREREIERERERVRE